MQFSMQKFRYLYLKILLTVKAFSINIFNLEKTYFSIHFIEKAANKLYVVATVIQLRPFWFIFRRLCSGDYGLRGNVLSLVFFRSNLGRFHVNFLRPVSTAVAILKGLQMWALYLAFSNPLSLWHFVFTCVVLFTGNLFVNSYIFAKFKLLSRFDIFEEFLYNFIEHWSTRHEK